MPRFLVFIGQPQREQTPTARSNEPPLHLIDFCRKLTKPPPGVGDIASASAGSGERAYPAKPVPFGPGAEDAYRAFKRECKHRARNASSKDARFLNRVNEHSLKIALSSALWRNPENPGIHRDSLLYAQAWANICVEQMIDGARGRIADNARQREHLDVRRWIEEAGPKGLSATAVAKLVNGAFDRRRRDDILRTLMDDEKSVVFKEVKTGGRPAMRYVSTRNFGASAA